MKKKIPLIIRLNGTDKDKALFMELLPIIKDTETVGRALMGKIDFEQVQFLAHCKKQYGTIKRNSQLNKDIAGTHINRLMSQGWSFSQIANWLNEKRYKTSRGKSFYSTTVRRIFEEKNKI